jgi:hypothetical protein
MLLNGNFSVKKKGRLPDRLIDDFEYPDIRLIQLTVPLGVLSVG